MYSLEGCVEESLKYLSDHVLETKTHVMTTCMGFYEKHSAILIMVFPPVVSVRNTNKDI